MSDGGKGSRPRPFSVSQQEYDTRWDAIFSRDLPKEIDDNPALQYNSQKQQEEYRVNKQGQLERFKEGQWELDPSKAVQ